MDALPSKGTPRSVKVFFHMSEVAEPPEEPEEEEPKSPQPSSEPEEELLPTSEPIWLTRSMMEDMTL